MVNIPKTRNTFCKGKTCRKHTAHKVTQYKTGKASLFAQGKRRYDRKQSGCVCSNTGTEDRPSPSSTRRQRPPRKLCCVSNAPSASTSSSAPSSDASTLSLAETRRPKAPHCSSNICIAASILFLYQCSYSLEFHRNHLNLYSTAVIKAIFKALVIFIIYKNSNINHQSSTIAYKCSYVIQHFLIVAL